jgi:hypothetical protein
MTPDSRGIRDFDPGRGRYPEITTWMMTRIEVASVIARKNRERPERC